MSKSNAIFPTFGETSPVTSQPASRFPSKPHLTRTSKDDDGVNKLPTPRTFLTPEDCPPGLDSLVEPEYIFMKQSFHAFDGWEILLNAAQIKAAHPESNAKYEVLDVFGQRLFMCVEKTEAAMHKIFCGGAIPFALRIFSKTSETNFRKEVLQMGGHPGSFGCGAEIVVNYEHKRLGRVEQDSDCSVMRYTVQNAAGQEVLKIIGPGMGACCSMGKITIHEFDVYLSDGHTHVGRIAKHWSGVPSNKEVFTRSDIWGVKFPREYDVRLKVLLLGAVFLMSYQFAER